MFYPSSRISKIKLIDSLRKEECVREVYNSEGRLIGFMVIDEQCTFLPGSLHSVRCCMNCGNNSPITRKCKLSDKEVRDDMTCISWIKSGITRNRLRMKINKVVDKFFEEEISKLN